MIDLLREIGQTLRNNRLRTTLTGVAVAWGIFMLIVLLGAARGVVNSFNDSMNETSTNTIVFWGGYTSQPCRGYKEGRQITLKGGDADALMRRNHDVSKVAAFASVDTAKIASERGVVSGGFQAVFEDAVREDHLEMLAGRFINGRDIAEGRRVLVLSDRDASQLFADAGSAVGKTVRCMGLAWTVAGVFTHPWRTQSYAPYTTYKAVTGNNDNAYQLTVTVENLRTEEDGEAAESALRATLGTEHGFAAEDNSAVWTWNRFISYLSNMQAMTYLNLAVWVIGIFTLLSGIVGVSNIMFVSVRERTHEIGIRRAIGAKPRSILVQILAESVAITAIFGYIGVFLGMVVLQVLSMFLGDSNGFKNPTVDISIALQVTVALIVAGALAGLFPALKAIKVKPVEALRDE